MFKTLVPLVGAGILPLIAACSAPVDSGEGSEESRTTDSAAQALTGSRPLLVVLLKRADNKPLAHTWSWYNDRIFGVAGGRNVVSYFTALSGNRFTYSRASMLSVRDPETSAFDARAGVTASDWDDARIVHAKRARLLAADVGMDYSVYDTNRNGTVSESELTILVIEKYTENGGLAPNVGCLNVSGVNVCGKIAVAGHRSAMMTYAHELAHVLSPGALDIYGAENNETPPTQSCHSRFMSLMSCSGANDGTGAYFMDPWHRGSRYGWTTLRRTVLLSGAPSGTQTLPPVGFGTTGIAESLELVGPNSESIILEHRSAGANPYEDAVAASGVVAWYRQAKSNGEPAEIASLRFNTTEKDRALFTLGAVGCQFHPMNELSRGKVTAMRSGGYRWFWSNGVDSGYLITVTPRLLAYDVSWSRTSAFPGCN
jgi:M6 family metalloprotease-like protein